MDRREKRTQFSGGQRSAVAEGRSGGNDPGLPGLPSTCFLIGTGSTGLGL